ncbi:MAG: NAD+ synthase [Pseudomonadota bacterium]
MGAEINDTFKLALAQANPVVGDLTGNLETAWRLREEFAKTGADLVVFSELFLTGYPLEDLVLKPALQRAARAACEELAKRTGDGGPAILMGLPWVDEVADDGKVYNAVALLTEGRIAATRYKHHLPNYGVFDEKRVFAQGPIPKPIAFKGLKLGVPICEDIWEKGVCASLVDAGADILIVPNGSPYWMGKQAIRYGIAEARVTETKRPLVYLNQFGGQDELVFDGASFVLNADGSRAVQMPAWEDAATVTDWRRGSDGWHCAQGGLADIETGDPANYLACVTGLRDYINKNGFPSVVLGLSGGIDSALCAVMAVDALGADRVHCIMLPYEYTSSESLDDAEQIAKALGVRYDTLPIHEGVEGLGTCLEGVLGGAPDGFAAENLQSRTRGTLLMAVSNKLGPLVLTTGNKSEVSVGYATLYGDMNGGFNPIKDLYKGQVYALSRYRNEDRPKGCLGPDGVIIPENVLTKDPSAELKPDQRDVDSLPPYPVLDDILNCLVEQELSVPDIVARGHLVETVKKVEKMLYLAEYKRRQAAPGVKITERNFGRDRRYPITNKFRESV